MTKCVTAYANCNGGGLHVLDNEEDTGDTNIVIQEAF